MVDINTGSLQAPYQEFEITIQPHQYKKVEYVTENFVLLDTTSLGALQVNFGGNVNQTNFATGVQYKLTSPVPVIQLYNNSSSPLTVHFALGIGDIKDNRLSLTGTVFTSETYTNMTVSEETFDAAGEVAISSPARKWIIQNTGTSTVFVGAANGLQITAGGSMTLPLNAAFTLYGTAGQPVVVAALS